MVGVEHIARWKTLLLFEATYVCLAAPVELVVGEPARAELCLARFL